ncbi:uncharacterized protein [Clytia hemisphaerica]|uniref:uncharacterized protein n=1 Tax=Clytia hemisphaerica TaxID=252671 RepID=UPI0034D39961
MAIVYKKNLFLSNSLIGVSLFTIGDIFEQKCIEKRPTIDFKRTSCMAAWGLMYGVTAHLWYGFMARNAILQRRFHTQILIYMLCFSPVETVTFYYFTGYLEGQTTAETREEVSKKFLPTYLIQNKYCVTYPFTLLCCTLCSAALAYNC